MDPAPKMVTWCNFTVFIMEDDDMDTASAIELQSDQANNDHVAHRSFSSPSLHPEEEESDFQLADDSDDVSGSTVSNSDGQPQAPSFSRLKKMESMMSQVKPAGSTVTYKCPAIGKSPHKVSPLLGVL